MIRYAETFATITPESASYGDYDETGFIDENLESDFRDMVDLLQGTEPSCSNIEQASWFSDSEYGHGTRDYFEQGTGEVRSSHPKTDRDLRYMIKAWKTGN